MKKWSFLLALTFAFTLVMQSCQKEEINDPYAGKEAPELATPEMFILPIDKAFDGFAGEESASPRTYNNWAHAAANVFVWNTILAVNLAVPVAAFYESFNHRPVYQGSGIWLWSYTVPHDGNTYLVKLYGELLATEEVKWDMYVSADGGANQIHWYTGITAWDHSYASWKLNFFPNGVETPFIDIEYVADNGSGASAIRYSNAISGNADNGDYIEYREGSFNGGEFDRGYDVYRIQTGNLLRINWKTIQNNGRVKDFAKFGDNEWHCWDTRLLDTQC